MNKIKEIEKSLTSPKFIVAFFGGGFIALQITTVTITNPIGYVLILAQMIILTMLYNGVGKRT